jgi:hypothetical protein
MLRLHLHALAHLEHECVSMQADIMGTAAARDQKKMPSGTSEKLMTTGEP